MTTSAITLYKETTSPAPVIGALILFIALLPGIVFANGQNTQFVPGEVMVKFKNETEPNQLLSLANQSNPPDIEILAPVADLLSDKTGIPLKVKQILSGAWVLMAIDPDTLITQSVAQLRKRNTITGIQLKASESQAVGTIEFKNIDVTFQSDSQEYKAIKAKLAGTADDNFASLIQDLSKNMNLPFQGEADKSGHLILQVDTKEITIELAKRLRSLKELIGLVQLNYVSIRMEKLML